MIYGHCMISGKLSIIVIESLNKITAYVRRTYKGQPTGKPFKRHIAKHKLVSHGYKVIRHDWLKRCARIARAL